MSFTVNKQLVRTTRIILVTVAGVVAAGSSSLIIAGHFVNLKEIIDFVGLHLPGEKIFEKPKNPSPEWIGVKIEYVTSKELPNYKAQTNLVETDRQGGDNLSLKDVDQDLSEIGRGQKNNSQDYAVYLRRVKDYKKPVCLEIYGQRIPGKSEFKNIIQISSWPKDKNYDQLRQEERDEECNKRKDQPETIIVYPKP